MKKQVFLCLWILNTTMSVIFGQYAHPNFVSRSDVFGTRVFIENMGQFDKDVVSNEKVHYALIREQEKMYFTASGVIPIWCAGYHAQRVDTADGE